MDPIVLFVVIVYLTTAMCQAFLWPSHKPKHTIRRVSVGITALSVSAIPVVLIVKKHASINFAASFGAYLLLVNACNVIPSTMRYVYRILMHLVAVIVFVYADEDGHPIIKAASTCIIVHHIFVDISLSLEKISVSPSSSLRQSTTAPFSLFGNHVMRA